MVKHINLAYYDSFYDIVTKNIKKLKKHIDSIDEV